MSKYTNREEIQHKDTKDTREHKEKGKRQKGKEKG
jgi:hypothetical protein